MGKVSEYFRRLRMDNNHHLGLGDIRLTYAQQTEIALISEQYLPIGIIDKYIKWKNEHPDEDYQLDEIGDFYAELSRSDKVEILEYLLTISA